MKRVGGFTLLELLIGLTLLGFMLALLFGGFQLAIRSWDTVETHVQRDSEKYAALAVLRRLLGTVEPLRQKRLAGQPLVFAGGPNRLVMVASLTEQVGLRTIDLAIEPQGGGQASMQRLILRDSPPLFDAMRLPKLIDDVRGRTLIDDMRRARFRYFGAMRPGEQVQWHDVWENANELPALIHMQFALNAGDPVDLVVATTISADRNALVRITAGPPS